MSTRVEFFGGLTEIGASKILVSTDQARALLDIGLPMGDGSDLFGGLVEERPGHELADRLRVGQAPQLPGIWDPSQLDEDSPLRARDPRPTALFISHAHLDHIGMAGMVDHNISMFASADTVRLCEALAISGHRFLGSEPIIQPIAGAVRIGDLEVESVPVDHDVVGACGYLVHTPDGTLAYTGDLNFHRNEAVNSRAFAERVRGAKMLVTETTMLSFDPVPGRKTRTEDEVLELVRQACVEAPGLALISCYERDVDRCTALVRAAREWGRTVVWPAGTAVLLTAMGCPGILTWDETRPQRASQVATLQAAQSQGVSCDTVSLAQVLADPSAFLVQLDDRDMPAMLDLPLSASTPWIHTQGEPLGPFMAGWAPFHAWLGQFGVPTLEVGSSGHASIEDLTGFVEGTGAQLVVPLHGRHPERLRCPEPILLPEYGAVYALDGCRLDS